MALEPRMPVRCRYNSHRTGVVESVVSATRGCDRGENASAWVRWADGTVTEVGEDDVLQLTIPPPGGSGDEGGGQ